MMFMIVVVVVHICAPNDITVLAERLVTMLAWKLGAWWKKLVRLFWSALVLEATGGVVETKLCVY